MKSSLKLLPEIRQSEQNFFLFQISSLNPEHTVMYPKDAHRMANSVDPDQTAPKDH